MSDAPPEVWSYEGVLAFRSGGDDPMTIHDVDAVQVAEVSGGGTFQHRRVGLSEDNRVGPEEGGSYDHRDLENVRYGFDPVGVVDTYDQGPLTETAGVVYAEVGADEPRWYWEPVEHAADDGSATAIYDQMLPDDETTEEFEPGDEEVRADE